MPSAYTTLSTFSRGVLTAASCGRQHHPPLTDEAEGNKDTHSRSPRAWDPGWPDPRPRLSPAHHETFFHPQLLEDGCPRSLLQTKDPISLLCPSYVLVSIPRTSCSPMFIFKTCFQLNCVHIYGALGICQALGKGLVLRGESQSSCLRKLHKRWLLV